MNSSMKADAADANAACKLTCDFDLLRRSSVFAGVNIDVVKLFAYLAKRKKFQPGELIVVNGEEAHEAFYLIAGEVEVYAFHRGKEAALQRLTPKTFFGELALLARFRWFFGVRAVSECEVLAISRESFNKVLEKYPENRTPLVEKVVQLRIERLNAQTHFMLDSLSDSLAEQQGVSSANITI